MLKEQKTAFGRLSKRFFSVQTASIEERCAKVIVIRCFTRATSKRCSSEKWITLHICFVRCVDVPSMNLDMENSTDIGGCAEKCCWNLWFLNFSCPCCQPTTSGLMYSSGVENGKPHTSCMSSPSDVGATIFRMTVELIVHPHPLSSTMRRACGRSPSQSRDRCLPRRRMSWSSAVVVAGCPQRRSSLLSSAIVVVHGRGHGRRHGHRRRPRRLSSSAVIMIISDTRGQVARVAWRRVLEFFRLHGLDQRVSHQGVHRFHRHVLCSETCQGTPRSTKLHSTTKKTKGQLP